MKKQKQVFFIVGGLWRDEINGNTYHNAKIISPNYKTLYTGFKYGYGSQYLSTASEYIKTQLKIDDFIIIDGGYFYLKKRQLVLNWF